MDDDLPAVIRTADTLYGEARRAGLLNGCVEQPASLVELLAEIDVGLAGADRHRRDDDALHQQVRAALDERPVLEGSGFAFVGVDDDVLHRSPAGDELPLLSGRKSRPALAAQTGLHQKVDDRLGRHPLKAAARPLVSAGPASGRAGSARRAGCPDAPAVARAPRGTR